MPLGLARVLPRAKNSGFVAFEFGHFLCELVKENFGQERMTIPPSTAKLLH